MTAPSPAHAATRFLGRYELMYLLGQGGMGEVHLARLTGAAGFEKLCIVKTILPQMMTDPQFVDRFHHEAKVLVQLNHSNIAQVYDMGDVEHTLYMAIEYVPGVDLARVEDRARAMDSAVPVPVALLIGQQMCEALGYAHRKVGGDGTPLGIVHRDVSPQNVMVSYEGEVKVIDFGLAKSSARSKHTLPSTVLGKLGYMSPEQARAERVDHRSDIYSAGIVIWELLAGRPLINGGTVGEMVAMMANPKIPALRDFRPEVSEAVERLVLRALQPDPSARFSRADDFARAINEQLVRENLAVGSEDVGNYVRAMCPEEFAAERQLQSRLSSMRKKGGSGASFPQSSPSIAGTMVRAPASGAALGAPGSQPRTPAPRSSEGLSPPPMTAAQRAMSMAVEAEQVGPTELTPAYVPTTAPNPAHAAAAPPAGAYLSGPVVVPKSKTPMVVVSLFALVALGGGGFAAWQQFGGKLLGGPEPVVVAPPPEKTDKPDTAPPEPAKEPQPDPVRKEPEPAKEPDKVAEPAAAPVPAKLERIEVKVPVWKIIRDGEKYYVQLPGKPRQLEKGDEVKILGPEIEKSRREVYGIASVVEVERSLARLLIDEDTAVPAKAFAIKETGPKRVARVDRPRAETPAADPAKNEPVKIEPAKNEPVKNEPAKVEPAKVEPAKVEPAKLEPVKADARKLDPARRDAVDPKEYKTLSGGVVMGQRRAKVTIHNRNEFSWHGCEVWLPIGKHFRYRPGDEIPSDDMDTVPFERFEDVSGPLDAQVAKGWALVRCREGAGYMQFKGN